MTDILKTDWLKVPHLSVTQRLQIDILITSSRMEYDFVVLHLVIPGKK